MPFDIKAGKVVKVRHAALPKLTGGYQKIIPVTVQGTPGATADRSGHRQLHHRSDAAARTGI